MSLITHPCTACGHPDFWRSVLRGAAPGPCSCGCRCKPGDPEARPSFDLAGRPVERVLKPGEAFGQGLRTCSCPACKALHEQLTEVV